MAIILGANTLSSGYDVANSCRFNDGDSASMTKSVSGTSQTTAGTISFWFKRGALSTDQRVWINYVDANNYGAIKLQSDNKIEVVVVDGGSVTAKLVTNRLFRDCSAWYHCVVALDSSNGTAGNRMRLYINGTEETSFATDTNPSSGVTMEHFTDGTNKIGQMNSDQYFDGYIAEFVMIHGSQLTPSSFGEFNSDSPTIWQPIDVSGLSFGSKDYYLDFEDSGDLDDDESGQGNDFTVSNLAATDQSSDSPTNNFATLNALDTFYVKGALSEGNLKYVGLDEKYDFLMSTIMVTSGKWYCEAKYTEDTGTDNGIVGISGDSMLALQDWLGEYAGHIGYIGNGGRSVVGGSFTSNLAAYGDGAIIGMAMDLDNLKMYFALNGTWGNSGDPTSGATGTGAITIQALSSVQHGAYGFACCSFDSGGFDTWEMNFGNPPYANSSSVADANGYGAFEYAPPSGYLALCTKNLGSDGG